jgi:hypothetical protein
MSAALPRTPGPCEAAPEATTTARQVRFCTARSKSNSAISSSCAAAPVEGHGETDDDQVPRLEITAPTRFSLASHPATPS